MKEIPTKLSLQVDTGSVTTKYYPERTTKLPDPLILIVINDRQFSYSDFSNLYFDLSSVTAVNAISPKNDSSKLYGKAGRNGILVIKTKNHIEWVSSRQILRQQSKGLFHSYRKTILKINDVLIDPAKEVYIQKDLIQSITANNDSLEFYEGKEYHKVINVSLTKNNGT